MGSFKPIILTFYKAMFADRDVNFRGVKFPLKKVNGLRRFDVGNLLFIEQNPRKKTQWARMARKGMKIMWVIDIKFNRYLHRVEDGVIKKLTGPSKGES